MTAEQKLAQKRLTLLQLTEKLGNVSKVCRLHKVSRIQFYEYKRSFQEYGIEGLVDKPPIPVSHPKTLPEEFKNRVIELSLEHPAFGQQHIPEEALRISGGAANGSGYLDPSIQLRTTPPWLSQHWVAVP